MTTAAPAAPEPPLDQADYAAPTLECDVVMKGGITSGVVYPLAVCELAKTYRFRAIGGTSAGAIAAAATGAAERGRTRGAGFRALAGLPAWLGRTEPGADRSNLFALFQPQPATRAIFDVAVAALGDARGRGGRVLRMLLTRFALPAGLGALPGVAVAALGTQARPTVAAVLLVLLGVGLAAGGAVGMAAWMLARRVRTEVPANGFGLCSGHGRDVGDPEGPPALTPWLADLLNRLAGKPRGDGPLTFGDLWGAGEGEGERAVDLRFMTTNLTHGRPYELPFTTREFFYDPEEFGKLFPAWVMRWMNDRARALRQETLDRRAAEEGDDGADADVAPSSAPSAKRPADPAKVAAAEATWARLLPLPRPADVPVVVAARLSLSFPLLISAVPLHAVDYMCDLPDEERAPERCWFSDGGICSNFPVHFFDAPLPARPTFGINLRPFPLHQEKSDDEARNTWFPRRNSEGIGEWFLRIPRGRSWAPLAGFAGLIVNTMQNWVDNTQLRVPGYRDRLAHVLLDEETEGGLNLDMPADVIHDLGERGRLAAHELARRFDPHAPPADLPLTWDNHRWVRFRSSMQLLEELLRDVAEAYDAPDPGGRTYADLVRRGARQPPASYRLPRRRAEQVHEAVEALRSLVEGDPLFDAGAPKPTPELRIRPRL